MGGLAASTLFARLSRAGEQWPPQSRARSARRRTGRDHPRRMLRDRVDLCPDGELAGPGAMVPARLVRDRESPSALALSPRAWRNRRAGRTGPPACVPQRKLGATPNKWFTLSL